jgi:polyisoprenoid-binding protein YceI
VIRGEFQRFDGRLCLDPAAPDSARMRLTVATDSVNTGLPELDQALRGPEFFHSERWPQAVFESRSVERLDEHRYRVRGELTLRDVTRELVAEFDLDPGRDQARLTGSHTMSRLDYGVGQGQWSDTRWAADKVTLAFDIRLVQADEAATGQAAAND